jgi:hypothetical protein
MAVGAIAHCLTRYGEATLITALQCVTQTANNQPGVLSARIIKALCDVLHSNPQWRDSGLALFEAFDEIDLADVQTVSATEAAARRMSRVQAMSNRIRSELSARLDADGSNQARPARQQVPANGGVVKFVGKGDARRPPVLLQKP